MFTEKILRAASRLFPDGHRHATVLVQMVALYTDKACDRHRRRRNAAFFGYPFDVRMLNSDQSTVLSKFSRPKVQTFR